MNQMYVLDKTTNQKYEMMYVEPKINDGIDGKKDLSFSIELNKDNRIPFNALVGRNFIVIDEAVHKSQRYFINAPNLKQEGGQVTKDITATHIYVFRLGKWLIPDTIQGTKSLDEALSHALKGSGFSYKIMDDAKKIPSKKLESFGNKYSIELMDDIISTYGVEIDVDNTMIYVYKKIGKKIVKTLDSSVNLTSLQINISEDNTTTRIKGYGKKKEEKDTLSDQSITYESKTGEWSYDSSLNADFTKKIGATFSFSFTGTGFKFKTLVSKLGGKWEFKIDDQTKTITTYQDSEPSEKSFDVIRGLDSKKHKVVATFKGKDSKNPNTKGSKGANPIMYLLRGNMIDIYRSFKSEDEQYVFPPVTYIHPEEKNFLIEGQPSWATTVTDESITTEADMIKVLKEKVNPYPTVTFEVDYEELLNAALKGIEDKVIKGDTIHVLADTELNGITFEDDIRVTKVSYNPLDSTEAPDLTIDGGEKDPVDLQVEQKKRIKDQQRYINDQKKFVESEILAAKKDLQLAIGETQNSIDSIPNTFSYTLRFTNGAWQATSSDASISIVGNTLLLETDDEITMKYASAETSSIMKQNGISAAVEQHETYHDQFILTFFQNGKEIAPLSVPADSKVTVMIIGFIGR
ncbi:hypothetical protein CHCC20347_0559 [Bacillus paralicheniformis]|nr:hypothetical protein CHCC20347_0559 [Bacillus paralicheniformis]